MLNRLQDVFKSFQRYEVKYVVIGGVASVLYGIPRATFDLDILIEETSELPHEKLTWKMCACWNCLIKMKIHPEPFAMRTGPARRPDRKKFEENTKLFQSLVSETQAHQRPPCSQYPG